MVLLNAGQVSVAISSAIVFFFTSILFLSGYILQQQTVHSLQVAIKPRLPAEPIPSLAPLDPAVKYGRKPGSGADNTLQQRLSSSRAKTDWTRLAHVQVVKDQSELCSAIMLFAELHSLKSPARRVLLFPSSWAGAAASEVKDQYSYTTKRLLRKAARLYSVRLSPMATVIKDADVASASSYSLTSVFALKEYDRVMYLSPNGLLFDSTPLDALLAYSTPRSLATLPARGSRNQIPLELLVMSPSSEELRRISAMQAKSTMLDDSLLRKAFPTGTSLDIPEATAQEILAYTSDLRSVGEDFNSTVFLEKTAYVVIQDEELPGPRYDVSYNEKIRIRPKDIEARKTWEGMYEMFRQRRMEVCGLDLDTWVRPQKPKATEKENKGQIVREEMSEVVNTRTTGTVIPTTKILANNGNNKVSPQGMNVTDSKPSPARVVEQSAAHMVYSSRSKPTQMVVQG
ncbi:glycosyltransferase family 8 protein [Patellaria atrata CBS 101060]|uniref:Glycosyltransferase family 8 protein n=1 Tax=Patellaria atrata CBS 101060 TaxID=1346257 RepID=A0A9P4S312_9PEZI|nr:glycosyltransferase family 8 protein [Patellaria atrata CBS 101060]